MRYHPALHPGQEAEVTELLAKAEEAHDALLVLAKYSPHPPGRLYDRGLLHHYDDLKSLFETYARDVTLIEEGIEAAKNEHADRRGFLSLCWMNADRKAAQKNLRNIANTQTHKDIVSTFNEIKANALTEVMNVPGSLQQQAFAKRVSDTKEIIREQDNRIYNWFAVLRGDKGIRLKEPQP